MGQACWGIWPDRGFLIKPDPGVRLEAVLDFPFIGSITELAARLPELLETRTLRATLDTLPVYDLSAFDLESLDCHVTERLMQIYSYFASAYIYGVPDSPANHIPAGVAVPLVQLAHQVQRPPILSYSNYVLNNWQRIDPAGEIMVDNLRQVQSFLGTSDESWFVLIHVDIEARAAAVLQAIQMAVQGAANGDVQTVERGLTDVHENVSRMITTFHRMPEGCNSDVYYFTVRPYIFGFNDVVYEGVAEFGGQPQTFRGQTGAQSSIVPALVAALGLKHEQNGLTEHLEIMKQYMPRPHRAFIAQMESSGVREFVCANRAHTALTEAYNECLRRVIEFRGLHYRYATDYIAKKVSNPRGTGGTIFMDWLKQLVSETEQQLI